MADSQGGPQGNRSSARYWRRTRYLLGGERPVIARRPAFLSLLNPSRLSSAFEQRKVTWRIAARRRGLLLFPPSSASQKPAARALAGTGVPGCRPALQTALASFLRVTSDVTSGREYRSFQANLRFRYNRVLSPVGAYLRCGAARVSARSRKNCVIGFHASINY